MFPVDITIVSRIGKALGLKQSTMVTKATNDHRSTNIRSVMACLYEKYPQRVPSKLKCLVNRFCVEISEPEQKPVSVSEKELNLS